MATGATPQQFVKRLYSKDTATNHGEVEVIARMKSCSGVPVYRVCPKTKDYRGEGATGYIALNATGKQTHFALYVKIGCVTLNWQQIKAHHIKVIVN